MQWTPTYWHTRKSICPSMTCKTSALIKTEPRGEIELQKQKLMCHQRQHKLLENKRYKNIGNKINLQKLLRKCEWKQDMIVLPNTYIE